MTWRRRLGWFLASLAVLGTSSAAAAQTPSKLYVGAAYEISFQNASIDAPAVPIQPPTASGGSGLGFNTTVGYRLSPLISVGAEVNLPTRFRVIGYDRLYQVHYSHREPAFSALVRFHLPMLGVIGPELVAGVSYVQEITVYQDASAPKFANPLAPYGPYGPEMSSERDSQRDGRPRRKNSSQQALGCRAST
jgi:hypothetical protein